MPVQAARAAGDGHVDALERPDVAVDRQLGRHAVPGVAPSLVAHLERHARALGRAHHRLPLGDAHGEGLLAEDVLAAPHGRDGNQRVPVVGGDDRHGIHGGIVDDAAPVLLHAAGSVAVLFVHLALEDESPARQVRPVAVARRLQHGIARRNDLDSRVLQELAYIAVRMGSASDDREVDAL